MTNKLYDEIKGEGINPDKFMDVYNVIRAAPEIDLDLLKVPGLRPYDLKKIFGYMSEKTGLLEKKNGKHIVSQEGIDVMEAKIKAGEMKKPITHRIKDKIPKRHGE
jgi:hypothetical protein